MKININDIKDHKQKAIGSCVPMSVECVLKLLGLMPVLDFSLQSEASNSGNSNWIHKGFIYPKNKPQVEFSREYLLSDIESIDQDRGSHFMTPV